MPSFFRIRHVPLLPLCCDFGVSERLVFKASVSSIYAVSIDMFLDILVEKGLDARVSTIEITTNYFYDRYNVSYFSLKKNEYWTIKWNKRINDK